MVKRGLVVLIILLLVVPGSVFAEKTSEVLDRASEKYDKHDKASKGVIDSAVKDIDKDLEENKRMLDLESNSNNGVDADESLGKFSKGAYNLTGKILVEVQRNSFPICLLGIIAGAMVFFILGPRNMPRRRYGAMLMLGFFSIWAIAQIAPVVFYLMI